MLLHAITSAFLHPSPLLVVVLAHTHTQSRNGKVNLRLYVDIIVNLRSLSPTRRHFMMMILHHSGKLERYYSHIILKRKGQVDNVHKICTAINVSRANMLCGPASFKSWVRRYNVQRTSAFNTISSNLTLSLVINDIIWHFSALMSRGCVVSRVRCERHYCTCRSGSHKVADVSLDHGRWRRVIAEIIVALVVITSLVSIFIVFVCICRMAYCKLRCYRLYLSELH